MSESLPEWEREAKRKAQAVPDDSIKITRDGSWLKVEGFATDRKVGFRVTQDEFEKMDHDMVRDYLIGIREKQDER